ncbi:MAG: L-threonylcarbamoyladenylate synthase [Clostridiales bacterium]|nr:L-threonylcarbamoyladenylate synthase [Eubacteriales bacterium]MDH7566322.1 L-threonylcarbamoyladenylate synthase [Clostridiales bacterium]
MKTEIIKIEKDPMDEDKLEYAAEVIRAGGLVAFPTETVYGLGANALDERAVKKIFEAKGRPSDNPLIVHIAQRSEADGLVKNKPAYASILMERFWPGPLTLIMDKADVVPRTTTAGLGTVAVRMPSHPVALALIRRSGLPIAAPSANTSGRPSPTCARHVIDDLYGKVDIIIDGGSAAVGLESTVLDITVSPPVILRPGGITPEELEKGLGSVVGIDPGLLRKPAPDLLPKSPGMKYKHYSPKADVVIIEGTLEKVAAKINTLIAEHEAGGMTVGVLATDQTKNLYPSKNTVISMGDRNSPENIAANLFKTLRKFDETGVRLILAEAVENTGIGLAVMNRMTKAAGYNIIRAD